MTQAGEFSAKETVTTTLTAQEADAREVLVKTPQARSRVNNPAKGTVRPPGSPLRQGHPRKVSRL